MKQSTSRPDPFLKRTALAALWTGLVLGLAVAWKWGWDAGAGFTLALLWGLANFAALAGILKIVTDPAGIRIGPLIGLTAVKLIGLYGFAIWVLSRGWVPLPAFVAGFSWTLAVLVLRALSSPTIWSGFSRNQGGSMPSGSGKTEFKE